MPMFHCHDKKCSLHSGIHCTLAGFFGNWSNSTNFNLKRVAPFNGTMEVNSSWLEVPWTRQGFLHPPRAGDSLLSLYIVLGQPDSYCFSSTSCGSALRLSALHFSVSHIAPRYQAQIWVRIRDKLHLHTKPTRQAFICLPLNPGICSPTLVTTGCGPELNKYSEQHRICMLHWRERRL